jgi:hypothetical protein
MKKFILPSALSLVLLGSSAAVAQAQPVDSATQSQPSVQPSGPAPAQLPPAPPVNPAPPSDQDEAPTAPPVSVGAQVDPNSGQWVYTSQYGWVWMPYAQDYTYVTPDESAVYSFLYYPTFGWRWVSAPWVLGVGPWPYWGVYGVVPFYWHAHPFYWRTHPYAWRGHPYYGRGLAVHGHIGTPVHGEPHYSGHGGYGGSGHGGGGRDWHGGRH